MQSSPLEVQVMGGLGNQLHGLAAGIAIAGLQNRELVIDSSRVAFGSNLSRTPLLHGLQLSDCAFELSFKKSEYSRIHRMKEAISRKSKGLFGSKISFVEPDYFDNFDLASSQISQIPQGVNSIGGPFIDFAWADLATEYGFPRECMPMKPSGQYLSELSKISENSIAIHIRLGDYLKHADIFPLTSENYYLNGLELINRSNSQEIIIFTDSPRLAQAQFPTLFALENLRIMNGKLSPIETMAIMSKPKTLISSNSTFSGWAGWFSGDKHVTTPIPHHRNNWQDRLPTSWTRLPIN